MSNELSTAVFSPRRILVRGVNWLGDAVMTTPALLRLRERFPDAHITLLTAEKLHDLWQHHPAVNETISFSANEGVFAVAKKLRAGDFDLAVVLPNSPRSALEAFIAGIPRRVGYARAWRNFFLTDVIPTRSGHVMMHKRSVAEVNALISRTPETRPPIPASAHQLHEYLQLVAALGAGAEPLAPQLVVQPEEVEAARQKFGLTKLNGPVFGLNPGAEYGPAKRWPVEQFIAAAREIQSRTNCFWVLFGGKNDQTLTATLEHELYTPEAGIRNLAGKTSLRELMALLKLCRVVLTNDTGPMHLAAAMGAPVVVPFGSTSPELTGPGLPGVGVQASACSAGDKLKLELQPGPGPRHQLLKSDAPCAPCFLRECPIDFRCMNGISVDRVVAAVLEAAR